MQMAEEWLKTWICLSFLFAWARAARPRFDVSTDMGMVLVPADAEPETAIFRLRATDQDADFPLIFEIIATTSPIVRVENLPCTLYNKVCQANVILTRRLVPGRLHDFVVRVRDSKGDVNSMQATISVTNSTTPRDKIFPHIPALIMVPEDTKPEKELDYLLVESNPWSGKPVYIELWQPKELFKIRQRQMGSQTKGIITLIGELDFETQSMYTLTMYATDPYTEPGKDTRNIAGLHIVVIVKDVQDVPPVFTLAPPLTKINNTVKPGDVILRVHAEDGDKGVPREVTYGLISEGNPFTPFFNVSETTGEIILAKPLEELTKITHVGAPIVLKIVAEEIRTSRDEPPAQATVVELGLLLGEPGNSPPYFENDNYVAWMDENAEPGTIVTFTDAYSTRVKDEDIGKAGVFALKLENNNGTFEISPAVAERTANFVITVRDNALIDYEKFKSLRFKIVAQEVGPATNLSASVPVTIFLRDINDNPPIFDIPVYEVTLSENANAGTRVVQVHATDDDAGVFGRIQYTSIIGDGNHAFEMNPDTGLITVSMGTILDREQTPRLELTVEARDEDGRGNRGIATLIVNILDVNDNAPIFEKGTYEFLLNSELTNFTMPAFIKAVDADAEPPNNIVRYEIVHGNYENKFFLNEETGELMLREAINKVRKVRQNYQGNLTSNMRKQFRLSDTETSKNQTNATELTNSTSESAFRDFHLLNNLTQADLDLTDQNRRRRAEDNPLFILTARAYDLGVPHLSNIAQIRIMRPMTAVARIVMFVMPGENPDPKKTAETLATITGSRVTIQEIKPYVSQAEPGGGSEIGKRSVVVARVEQNTPGTVVDVDKIRESLAANGFGIISGMDGIAGDSPATPGTDSSPNPNNSGKNTKNVTVVSNSEEVTVYKAENKLLTWLLVLLGLLLLAAIITLIICCICPSCPFYMEPRKRRIHSSETLVIHSDSRPKRHLHRKPIKMIDGYNSERKEAWSADPARQHWQFNRRNTKNLGIASLPGDVVPGHQNPEIERLRRAASLRNAAEPTVFGEHVLLQPPRVIPMPPDDERIYMEDMEAQQQRNYEQAEMDSLRRHELDRGSDGGMRNGVAAAALAAAAAARQEPMREQHFYRDGNAEVLRLVTRGEIEDHKDFGDRHKDLYHANGKDILLQRFIEDQKLRRSQDLRDSFHESLHEADVDRSMESHQRANETTEILILPERLELQRQPSYNQRQHQQEQMLNVDVQRLIIERNYKSKDFKDDDGDEYRSRGALRASMRDAEVAAGEASRSVENVSDRDRNTSYPMHDVELVRQNALLTRLLLEKETRGLNVPIVDSSSFLETQSLPGQVAIATQTDRTTATQTEFFARSRSDNEESEEDPRIRRKSKLKGRIETKEDFKKMKTIWVRTPIPEESRAQSGNKKVTPTRTKIEVTESRKVSISPDVLKDISNSLKSGESGGAEEDEDEEVLEDQVEIKPDKMQKVQKAISKPVGTSKKKTKEARVDNDSTTPSPETKEKNALIKSKIRKKIEKPPRAKKLQKSMDSEKSHFMEPSFRVLEREISSFQQKIRQFGDKKLKMLKKDDSKKEKESEDDDGTTYDVSKKCEVTVKKTKKSISRESSPTKISVEQRTKTSEEDSCTKEKKTTKQPQQNISSSDFEEFDKPRRQPTHFSARTTQYETSKMQTRSRSKLRRQTHMETSDTKSSSEKIEKSEDSESKTEKSKESTSSAEMKIDSNSSSSKDFGKQQNQTENEKIRKSQAQEAKNVKSQKVATKVRSTGMVDLKRKITSLKSKSVDEPMRRGMKKDEKPDKAKSLTSENSKLTSSSKSKESVYNKKFATSEEEKLSLQTKPSTSKESMTIDLDKLVQDVRGVVEKEISSLTQAAKDALIINKLESSTSDKKDERIQSQSKSMESEKVQPVFDNKSQSIDATKHDTGKMKSIEKDRMQKSTETKEKREKMMDHKEKSKSRESTSQSKSQTDEAISFIVIENGKSTLHLDDRGKKYEESIKDSNKLEKSDHDNQDTQNDEKSESKKNVSTDDSNSNALDIQSQEISEKDNETEQNISDKVAETKQLVSDVITESKKEVSSKIVETDQKVSDVIDQTKQFLSNEIDETKTDVSNKIDESKQIMEDKIAESSKNISNKINENKNIISDTVDKTEKHVSDAIDKTVKHVSDIINKTEKHVSDTIDKTETHVSDTISEIKQITSDQEDKTKQNISHEINETNKMVSDKIGKSVKVASDKIDEIKKNIIDEVHEIETNLTDKINVPIEKVDEDITISDAGINVDEKAAIPTAEITTSIGEVHNLSLENSQKSTTKIVNSNIDTSKDTTESKTSDTVKGTENTDSKVDLVKPISTSLPNEIRDQEAHEIKEAQSEIKQTEINKDLVSSSAIGKSEDITKDALEREKPNVSITHLEQITKEESITALSDPSKEKDSTAESIQMKQTKEAELHEEILNKEDVVSPSDSKSDEASPSKMTQIKETKEAEAHLDEKTDKKEFTPSGITNETTVEVSQVKQAQGQTTTTQAATSTDTTKEELVSAIEESRTKSSTDTTKEELISTIAKSKTKSSTDTTKEELVSTIEESQTKSAPAIDENEETKESPIKVSPPQPDHSQKSILQVTVASDNEEEDEEEEESDNDSSSTSSDISNKTALRTRPYSTPRHSISSDGGGDKAATPRHAETSTSVAGEGGVKSDGRERQRWSSERERDPLLKVDAQQQQSRESSKAVFPQKIEVTPMDKPKISANKTEPLDQTEEVKSTTEESQNDLDEAASTSSKSMGYTKPKIPEVAESKQRSEATRPRPVIVAVKKKEQQQHHQHQQYLRTDHFSRHTETRKSSPRRDPKSDDKNSNPEERVKSTTATSTTTTTTTSTSTSTSEQRKVEIRSRHLKLHVSHHYRQPKDEAAGTTASSAEHKKPGETSAPPASPSRGTKEEAHTVVASTSSGGGSRVIDYGKDPEIANARSRYMAWYQQKRAEMERKRRERKEAEEEQQKPRWMRKTPATGKTRKAKSAEDGGATDMKGSSLRERAKSSSEAAQQSSSTTTTPRAGGARVSRLRIRPLVNVESEQLKAIVRQGRKLRKAEGTREEDDPPVQIFAPEKPPPPSSTDTLMQIEPRHHLTQHSEYKYEKTMPPMPFYLHPPPPVPHPSPEHFQDDSSESRRMDDDLDSGIAVSLQGGTRLRHQQLLEKKSVFDIAYNEASPTQLRSDSSTPPS